MPLCRYLNASCIKLDWISITEFCNLMETCMVFVIHVSDQKGHTCSLNLNLMGVHFGALLLETFPRDCNSKASSLNFLHSKKQVYGRKERAVQTRRKVKSNITTSNSFPTPNSRAFARTQARRFLEYPLKEKCS